MHRRFLTVVLTVALLGWAVVPAMLGLPAIGWVKRRFA